MGKCDFTKVAEQLLWNHTSVWVFSCKFAAYLESSYFDEHLWRTASANFYSTCVSYFVIQIRVLFTILLTALHIRPWFCLRFSNSNELDFVDPAYRLEGWQKLCNSGRENHKESCHEILEATQLQDTRQQQDWQTLHQGHALLLWIEALELHPETITNAGRLHWTDYWNVPAIEGK